MEHISQIINNIEQFSFSCVSNMQFKNKRKQLINYIISAHHIFRACESSFDAHMQYLNLLSKLKNTDKISSEIKKSLFSLLRGYWDIFLEDMGCPLFYILAITKDIKLLEKYFQIFDEVKNILSMHSFSNYQKKIGNTFFFYANFMEKEAFKLFLRKVKTPGFKFFWLTEINAFQEKYELINFLQCLILDYEHSNYQVLLNELIVERRIQITDSDKRFDKGKILNFYEDKLLKKRKAMCYLFLAANDKTTEIGKVFHESGISDKKVLGEIKGYL